MYVAEMPERMAERERKIAREVQAAFLPKTCRACPGARVATRHVMSGGIGGDLYDFPPGQGRSYSLVIGDVTGHQLFSALVMSLIFGTIHAVGPKSRSPLDVVRLVNDLLCELNGEMRSSVLMCSLFYGTVYPDQRRMVYANAGHPGPLAWRQNGRIETLDSTCPILGVGLKTGFVEASLDLADVDRLLLYTDGITEARDPTGRFFGTDGMIEALASREGLCVERSLDRLFERLSSFMDGRTADDMTAVLVDFRRNK